MKDWVHFVTLLMTTIVVLIMISSLYGCAFMVAKETAKVIDTVLEGDPNPSKKEKILIKQNKMKQKAREFYCSKVEDPIKCDE
jgi:hypothetical protein